jgi:hypothetical protein
MQIPCLTVFFKFQIFLALECYVDDIPDGNSLRGHADVLKLNKMMNLTQPSFGIGSAEEPTKQCPAASKGTTSYCFTYHCTLAYGKIYFQMGD